MTARHMLTLAMAAVLLAACGGDAGPDTAQQQRDTMTQRQRDSTLGASSLPGARGVSRALEVSDSAAARDSLQRAIGDP